MQCATTQEALEKFAGSLPGTYDLILMDVQMHILPIRLDQL